MSNIIVYLPKKKLHNLEKQNNNLEKQYNPENKYYFFKKKPTSALCSSACLTVTSRLL